MPNARITWTRLLGRKLLACGLVLLAALGMACTRTDTSGTNKPSSEAGTGTGTGAGAVAATPDTGGGTAGLQITSGMTPLTGVEGDVNAYTVHPEAPGAWPAVVVIHEWWGLNDQIKSVADRIAGMGYYVVVPDLYHGVVADDPEKAHELTRGLEDSRALSDITAAATLARTAAGGEGARTGVVGFCMGGRLALLAAMSDIPLHATVMFYGPPVTEPAELAKVRTPILALFGRQDEGIPETTVKTFEDNLKAAGKSIEVVMYDNAGHAFMNDTRPSFSAEAARNSWGRLETFFAQHLKS
jgi:carboxymethylenebutenolidase